jgi:hypothetical protein
MEQMPRARDELPFRDVAPDAAATLGPRPVHRVPMLGDPHPFGRSFVREPSGATFGHFTSGGGPGNGTFDWGAPLPPLPPPPPPRDAKPFDIAWTPAPASDHDRRITELEEWMTKARDTLHQTEVRLSAAEERLRLLTARLDRVDRDTSAQHAMARAMKDDTEAILSELRKADK